MSYCFDAEESVQFLHVTGFPAASDTDPTEHCSWLCPLFLLSFSLLSVLEMTLDRGRRMYMADHSMKKESMHVFREGRSHRQ